MTGHPFDPVEWYAWAIVYWLIFAWLFFTVALGALHIVVATVCLVLDLFDNPCPVCER